MATSQNTNENGINYLPWITENDQLKQASKAQIGQTKNTNYNIKFVNQKAKSAMY